MTEKPAKPRNVVIFYTDQQRGDSLGCVGNKYARTPNIDSLAARGNLYSRHYATNPVCMPSRSSFLTGRTTLAHRVLDNGIFLPAAELTMAEAFRRAGYRTVSVGKLHLQTYKSYPGDASMESMERWAKGELDNWHGPYYGFEEVRLTTAHGENVGGHYGRWRAKRFPGLKLGPENAQSPEVFRQFISYKSNIPLEAHHSTWVADNAVDVIEKSAGGDKPLFLFVSFPDPHHPFTPPAPYSTMYDGVEFDPPHAVPGENDAKPKPYRDAMISNPFPKDGGVRWFRDFKGAAYNQVLAHTYGMIALIDDCVGRVLAKLSEKRLRGDTIVAFTSDHGDFLGDHHFLYKGQLPCRSLLHIPLIIADPTATPCEVDGVTSNLDVMPTLLSKCGIEVPDPVQGVLLPAPGEAPLRDYAFEAGWSKALKEYHHFTINKQDWRISVFPNLRDGEMYDLENDPYEHRNLFNDPAYRSKRDELIEELLFAVGAAEPKMPPVVTDW
jgi:arylsulfatase A-like enzyme